MQGFGGLSPLGSNVNFEMAITQIVLAVGILFGSEA